MVDRRLKPFGECFIEFLLLSYLRQEIRVFRIQKLVKFFFPMSNSVDLDIVQRTVRHREDDRDLLRN